MQIANVKHSHCEAKFGFRVWETKFGCVHRKTSPASECIHGIVPRNADLIKRLLIKLIWYYLSDR